MQNILNFGKIKWVHLFSPTKEELNSLIEEYDFHELIEDDLLEVSNQEKIDVYEDYIFLVLNFPKYNSSIRKYIYNEFSIILWKGIIVTISRFETNHIDKIIEEYKQELKEREADEDFKISTYYILYKIIDTMYDKTYGILNKSARDVVSLEEQLFSSQKLERELLENLMIKKRNIAFLKHLFVPHGEILTDLQDIIPKFYKEDLDVYFEDLVFKQEKILSNIAISYENVESLSETYNSLMNIKTNSLINVLTIFAAITWILTLISWIYGMNITLPLQENWLAFWIIMAIMGVACIGLILIFRKKKRI